MNEESAFPCPEYYQHGLTKREYFAGLAMQGMLSIPPKDLETKWTVQEICDGAVEWADSMLEALEKK